MAALAGQSTTAAQVILGICIRTCYAHSPESIEIVRAAPIGLVAPLFKPVTMPPLCFYWLHPGVSFVAFSVYPFAGLFVGVRFGWHGLSRAKS
jgi:hypothetical protein